MRTWTLVMGAVLGSAAFVVVLLVDVLSAPTAVLVSDVGQLVAAVLASAGCAVAAVRSAGQRRRAWVWLAVGTGCWAAGEVVWTCYEVVLAVEVPFPSEADVGFLLFPVAAAVGLVVWLGTQSHELVARGRDLLDGAIIAASLLVLSWITTLGQLVSTRTGDTRDFLLGLAYPVADIVLGTLVLIALARGARSERLTLGLLALGLGGLAFSDSLYAYLTSQGRYASADLTSSGWVAGFLFVGVAGLTVRRGPAADETVEPAVDQAAGEAAGRAEPVTRPSLLSLCLPYAPLVAAGIALCVSLLEAPETRTVELLLGVGLVVLVLTRQFLAMLDNQRLLIELGIAHGRLEHQALHDALTGLPNRVLFADRLDRALLRQGADVSVLFCDLDDFKLVNDGLGHDAGDQLLSLVAERLLSCVRLTDTVARLGGDEFAILLEDSDDAVQVAERVVASMQDPVRLHGRDVRTSISVGIAHHRGALPAPAVEHRRSGTAGRTRPVSAADIAADAQREAAAALLLRQADTAMYAAKGAGKSRAVLSDAAPG